MEAKTLQNVFAGAVFPVPSYQRGYAWEDSQLEDFWKDLMWLRSNQRHYTGMLTLHRIREISGGAVYNIVDGQQGITTSFLLISKLAARNEFLAGEPKQVIEYNYLRFAGTQDSGSVSVFSRVGYESEDRMKFLQTVLDERAVVTKRIKKIKPKNVYENNLLNASNFFDKKLENMSPIQMSDIFSRVKNKLIFDVHYVENSADVSVMFESINYRGIRLTKFEVLKNRLIYICQLMGQADESVRDAADEVHREIEAAELLRSYL